MKRSWFNTFRPVLTAIQNNRDHRKITIIDGKVAFFPKNEVDERIESDGFVQPYSDSPVDNENVGEHVYLQIINNAKDYVYICTPYLFPMTR